MRSLMNSDLYIRKELYAKSRRQVARIFTGTRHVRFCRGVGRP